MKFLLFAHYQFYTHQKDKLFKGSGIHIYTAFVDSFLLTSLFTGLVKRFLEPQMLKGLWLVLFATVFIFLMKIVKKESFIQKCEIIVSGLNESNKKSLNFILGVLIFFACWQFLTVVLGW